MLELISSCGLDSERISVCYDKLQRPEDFSDDSSFLGSWMNAAEAKSGVTTDIIKILLLR